ncbi:hypothetical protein [Streptomyces sp. NPDC050804]|uniref:hypothetical protein n=1 Tax=Streptomyces sp. NPDC050804 TaxID=3154745 RepID=UPI0034453103
MSVIRVPAVRAELMSMIRVFALRADLMSVTRVPAVREGASAPENDSRYGGAL